MKKLFPAILLLAAFVLSAPMASAKPLSKIIREIGLTPDDFTLMNAVADSLYVTGTPRPGKVVSWSNPDSNSHGTAKLAAMRENCAYLQHFVFPKGAEKSKEIRLRVCKQDNGSWQLQP